MKKISSVLFFMCIFSLVSHSCAMENSYERGLVAHANVTQAHLDQFLTIVKGYTPFSMHGVFRIKQLAKDSKEWAGILKDSSATGKLIEYVDQDCKQRNVRNCKARMACDLATQGSLQWCKEYLLTHEHELQIMSNDFLSAVRQSDYTRAKNFLSVGIDVNVADQGNIESGCAARKFCYPPALISATKQMNLDLVALLLAHNADPNVMTKKHENTPLIITIKRLYKAEQTKNYENCYKAFAVLNMLLASRLINPSLENDSQKSPLNYAIDYEWPWLQTLLVFHEV